MAGAHRSPLLGRADELARLGDHLGCIVDGGGRGVLIEGEAGIGKTTLLTEVLARARDLGFTVWHGAADELDQRRPFGALADCLRITPATTDTPRARVAHLLFENVPWVAPVDVTTGGTGTDFRASEAMLNLLEDLATGGPVVLCIDDLQWADAATCLVLHHFARQIQWHQALLLLGCRPSPRRPELAQLIDGLARQGTGHLVLGPLRGDDVAELVSARVGATAAPALLDHVSAAGGNPLFVTELVAALQQEDCIVRLAGRADVRTAHPPAPLSVTILRRLSILPDDVVDLLRLASVLGSGFTVQDLGLFAGKSAAAMTGAVRASLAAGVLVEQAEGLAFRHELIRDALYFDLPVPMRTALHREAATALATGRVPVVRIAEHLMRGASRGDREAIQWLRTAGHDVALRAPGMAVGLFRKALDLAEAGDPLREELLADLCVVLAWGGQHREVEVLCREALRRPQAPGCETTFRMCLVQILLPGGGTRAALDEVEAAVASPLLPRGDRARFEALGSTCRLILGDLEGATDLACAAHADAATRGDPYTAGIALATQAAVAHFRGSFSASIQLAQEAVALGDSSPNRQGHRFPLHLFQGLILLAMDRIAEGQRALETGRSLVEELGNRGTLVPYHWALAMGHFWAGEWDDALAECAVSRELATDIGTHQGMLYSHALAAMIALHRGDMAASEAAVAVAEENFRQKGPQFGVHWMLLARSLLLEATGAVDAAYDVLCRAWDGLADAGMVSEFPLLGPDLARLALHQGDRHRAEGVTHRLEQVADAAHVPTMSGVALRCRGLLERDPAILARAVEALRAGPRPLDLAAACEEAAVAALEVGAADEGRRLFNQALGIYEGLGAVRDMARADGRMRAFGMRRGVRDRRNRPKVGWDALTATQLRVVELVTEGLSNPQIADRMFISRRTVATHVSDALARLGMASRTELAAESARRRARDPSQTSVG